MKVKRLVFLVLALCLMLGGVTWVSAISQADTSPSGGWCEVDGYWEATANSRSQPQSHTGKRENQTVNIGSPMWPVMQNQSRAVGTTVWTVRHTTTAQMVSFLGNSVLAEDAVTGTGTTIARSPWIVESDGIIPRGSARTFWKPA